MNYWKYLLWDKSETDQGSSWFLGPFPSSAHSPAVVIHKQLHSGSRPSGICEQNWSASQDKQLINNILWLLLFITFSCWGSKLCQLCDIAAMCHMNVIQWVLRGWCMSQGKWERGMGAVLKALRPTHIWTSSAHCLAFVQANLSLQLFKKL